MLVKSTPELLLWWCNQAINAICEMLCGKKILNAYLLQKDCKKSDDSWLNKKSSHCVHQWRKDGESNPRPLLSLLWFLLTVPVFIPEIVKSKYDLKRIQWIFYGNSYSSSMSVDIYTDERIELTSNTTSNRRNEFITFVKSITTKLVLIFCQIGFMSSPIVYQKTPCFVQRKCSTLFA